MLDPKLESLIAVQESGSFTRAAEALSLTQPAISQHVKQLEKELQDLTDKRCKDIDELTAKKEQELMAV